MDWVWYRAFDYTGTASVLLVTAADNETVAEWNALYDDGTYRVESYRRSEGEYWDGDLLTPQQAEYWRNNPTTNFND